ncbi:hypothetical protein FRC11_000085, partial [Ceratobasidium sp. 423]
MDLDSRLPASQATRGGIRSSQSFSQLRLLNTPETPARGRRRHEDFFPPGIGRDVALTNQPEFTNYPVAVLYDKLLDRDRLRYTDNMLVTSASYYKSRRNPGHELLLFTIADRADEPLNNYMLLDRTPRSPPKETFVVPSGSMPRVSQLLGGPANDQFCISYRGDRTSLLEQFGGPLLDELGVLVFPIKAFYLYELIILAYVTSSDRPDYHLFKSQCYWFACTIWETMKGLIPEAGVKSHTSTRTQLLGLNIMREPSITERVIEAFKEQRSIFRSELERRRPASRSTRRYPTAVYYPRQPSSSEADLSRGLPQALQRANTVDQGQLTRPARIDEVTVEPARPRPT